MNSHFNNKKWLYRIGAVVAGGFLLAFLSTIQRLMFDHPVEPREFAFPILVGGTIGYLLAVAIQRIYDQKEMLETQKEQIQDLLDNATDLIQSVNPQGGFIYVNQAWKETLKYTHEEIEKMSLFDIIASEDLAHCQTLFNQILNGEKIDQYETTFIAKDGRKIYLAGKSNIRTENGKPVSTRSVLRNISSEVRANELKRLTAKVFETANEGIMVTDNQGIILVVNNAFTEITGFSSLEACGQTPSISKSGWHSKEFYEELWSSIIKTESWQGEIWNTRKNGEIYPAWLTINAVKDETGNVSNYVGALTDITHRKQSEQRFQYLALHDPLTGLANRIHFNEQMEIAIQQAHSKNFMVAVLYLDLDGFKDVNDKFGHNQGDVLMKIIAQRMVDCVRKTDTVARLGGDEFAIILPGIENVNDVEHVARKILSDLASPYFIGTVSILLTASIGISIYPHHGLEVQSLLQKSDAAMYMAKQGGKNSFVMFKDNASL